MTGAESLFTGKDEIGDKNGYRICIYNKLGQDDIFVSRLKAGMEGIDNHTSAEVSRAPD